VPYLSASALVIHYEEALYLVYAPLPLPYGEWAIMQQGWHMMLALVNMMSALCALCVHVIVSDLIGIILRQRRRLLLTRQRWHALHRTLSFRAR